VITTVQYNARCGLGAHRRQLQEVGAGFDNWSLLSEWMDHKQTDVVALQETGIVGEEAPAALLAHVQPHKIVCHGASGAGGSVAIVVNRYWTIGRIWRDQAGTRALAVLIHRGPITMFVASVYLPSGLDGSGPGSIRGAEALRILDAVNAWMCECPMLRLLAAIQRDKRQG
jgi:exonuclease III